MLPKSHLTYTCTTLSQAWSSTEPVMHKIPMQVTYWLTYTGPFNLFVYRFFVQWSPYYFNRFFLFPKVANQYRILYNKCFIFKMSTIQTSHFRKIKRTSPIKSWFANFHKYWELFPCQFSVYIHNWTLKLEPTAYLPTRRYYLSITKLLDIYLVHWYTICQNSNW